MTDSQAINSSEPVNSCELAMMLDKITAFASRIETLIKREGNINHFSWHAHHDLTSALPHLDALRALVAEQEQASAGEQTFGVFRDGDNSIDISGDSPQFAVGDTVKATGTDAIQPHKIDSLLDMVGLIGKITAILEEEKGHEYRVSFDDNTYGRGAWYNKGSLTLIAKVQA